MAFPQKINTHWALDSVVIWMGGKSLGGGGVKHSLQCFRCTQLRRRPNIDPTMIQCLVFAGIYTTSQLRLVQCRASVAKGGPLLTLSARGPSLNVRFWRLKLIPALKELKIIWQWSWTHDIGIRMQREELTKPFMRITNWKQPFGLHGLYKG